MEYLLLGEDRCGLPKIFIAGLRKMTFFSIFLGLVFVDSCNWTKEFLLLIVGKQLRKTKER